jgi:hypothetical protein
MIVAAPGDGLIERWSLETFERETTRPFPFDGVFKTMAMGYAADGPLLIHSAASTDALGRSSYELFDIETFKPYPVAIRGHNTSYRDAVHIRASATGNTFGLWATSHSPQGMEVMRLVGGEMLNAYQHNSAGHIVPNFDGSAIFTAGAGVCSPELNMKTDPSASRLPLIPSTHPRFYVAVPSEPGIQRNLGRDPFEGADATLHILGKESRIINLPPLQLGRSEGNPSWTRSDFSLDKRVHYIVAGKQIVTIPFSNDRIIVQPFDFEVELAKARIDYLFVTSVAPAGIYRGRQYRYQIEVATSVEAAPRFELASGPDGMEVSQDGLVTWDVPRDLREQSEAVILTISTPDGQSVYETFDLSPTTDSTGYGKTDPPPLRSKRPPAGR